MSFPYAILSEADVTVTVTKPVIKYSPDDDRPPMSRIAFGANIEGPIRNCCTIRPEPVGQIGTLWFARQAASRARTGAGLVGPKDEHDRIQ
jgi:hypothetical protein